MKKFVVALAMAALAAPAFAGSLTVQKAPTPFVKTTPGASKDVGLKNPAPAPKYVAPKVGNPKLVAPKKVPAPK